jgi:hypothetical protein
MKEGAHVIFAGWLTPWGRCDVGNGASASAIGLTMKWRRRTRDCYPPRWFGNVPDRTAMFVPGPRPKSPRPASRAAF